MTDSGAFKGVHTLRPLGASLSQRLLVAAVVVFALTLGVPRNAAAAWQDSTSVALAAQQGSQSDNVARLFFHPRLVMANAQRIGLTEDQRRAIQAEVDNAQEEFRSQRFELQNAMTVLAAEAVQHPVDEAGILARLAAVLEIEDRIKQTQLTMLVRIKNLLTPEQHVALDEARRRARQNAQQQRPRPRP